MNLPGTTIPINESIKLNDDNGYKDIRSYYNVISDKLN
jgi:hypothetical protein